MQKYFLKAIKQIPEYAMQTLKAAYDAGADSICLCETTGGSLPNEISEIVARIVKEFKIPIGIHCHNDSGMAVANSIIAVNSGATQVQGTINGYGERCGNANLCTLIPTLQLKMGYNCIPDENIDRITSVSRYIDEIANTVHDERCTICGTVCVCSQSRDAF